MKLLGIVVLYYPDSDVYDNISTYIYDLDELILWDNTPNVDQQNMVLNVNIPVQYVTEGENVGIGKALNFAAKYAIDKCFTHLLTMDQDSSFPEKMFSEYKRGVNLINDERVRAICISTNENESSVSEKISYVDGFITSGTIHPVSAFMDIGFFMEELFIDSIDTEYAFRILKNEYKTVKLNDIIMTHRLGNVTTHPFLWGKLMTPNYSAERTYYISRNYFIVKKKYKKYKYLYHPNFVKTHYFWRFIDIIFVEKDKLRKLKAMFWGILHGLKGKTGICTIF